MNTISRRHFLSTTASVTAGFLGLRNLVPAQAERPEPLLGYGPLIPDPNGIFDLPKGFSYSVIAKTGDEMVDGLLRPGGPDGMGAFPGEDGRVIVICNHELSYAQKELGAFGKENERFGLIDPKRHYGKVRDDLPCLGGTSTMVYDPATKKLVRQFLSLSGTERNCAGGQSTWNSWISAEEPSVLTEPSQMLHHGYAFDVAASEEPGLVEPIPLKDMGRFRGEAVAIDKADGSVYQSEDRGDGLLYRFLPDEPEKLTAGGKLMALAIKGRPKASVRNWDTVEIEVGKPVEIEWIEIDDIESKDDGMRLRGHEAGAALFARAEGMWAGDDGIYIACTNGGAKKLGQIFRLRPSDGTIELFVEATEPSVLEMCDNLTVSPWGDLVVCEDGGGEQFLRGVTPDGQIYTLGRNAKNNSELCGAVFAPNHPTLFVNIQWNPGITLAITGPWKPAKAAGVPTGD